MRKSKRRKSTAALFFVLSIVMIAGLILTAFSPASSINRVKMKNELSSVYLNNEVNTVLSQVVGIETVRSLPYDFSTPSKAPDKSNYFTDGNKKGYKDSTIEVVCWKETHKNNAELCFADITIKHPSQFRRQWSNGDYNSNKYQTPLIMFNSSKGVIGMSADFYKFRKYGIIVQYGTVICDVKGVNYDLDVLVVDYNGDFHIWKDNDLRDHIQKNGADDIMLSFTFGPALIVDGKPYDSSVDTSKKYQLGEPMDSSGRTAIGQLGKLHYLLCTVGNPGSRRPGVADIMAAKGCITAYNLDGGQSGTMLFDSKVYNKIAYKGNERPMSDILYFASAE